MVQDGAKMGQHSPNITSRWANMAPNIDSRWANIVRRWANLENQGAFPRQPQNFGEKMLRRDSDAISLAIGESVSRVNSQHDPKTIQMDLMMGREAARGCRSLFRPLGSVSWIKFLFPRHGRCWAKPIQSGHAVQRKRCGSLNRSFSYWEAARSRRPFREASPGTSQATGGSLQVLIGGVPVPSRIQLFQRNGVAKMEWVPRRPLGRAFSSKILGMKVKS